MHPFVFLTVFPPFGEYRHKFAQHFRWEYDQSRKDGAALRVRFKNKLCADAKVATASADAPEQLGVLGLAESERRSIRRDNSRLLPHIRRSSRQIEETEHTRRRLSTTRPY